jgi:hypothetical protein
VAESLDAEAKASIHAEWARLEPASVAVSVPMTRAGFYDPQMQAAMTARIQQMRSLGYYPLSSLASLEYTLEPDVYDYFCDLAISRNSPIEYTIVGIKEEFIQEQVGPLVTHIGIKTIHTIPFATAIGPVAQQLQSHR